MDANHVDETYDIINDDNDDTPHPPWVVDPAALLCIIMVDVPPP
jgi:hypothetical protein